MLCSRNEIRTLATKAARGAGLPWGVSDEAGRAACWLEARGLTGLSALDRALEGLSEPDWRQCFPMPAGARWYAKSGNSDGLLAGITLADRCSQIARTCSTDALVLVGVRWPLLTIPFLSGVAEATGMRLAIVCDPEKSTIDIGPQSVSASCRVFEDMAVTHTLRIERIRGATATNLLPNLNGSIPVAKEIHASLERLAERTYVPESEESRIRGAGVPESSVGA